MTSCAQGTLRNKLVCKMLKSVFAGMTEIEETVNWYGHVGKEEETKIGIKSSSKVKDRRNDAEGKIIPLTNSGP